MARIVIMADDGEEITTLDDEQGNSFTFPIGSRGVKSQRERADNLITRAVNIARMLDNRDHAGNLMATGPVSCPAHVTYRPACQECRKLIKTKISDKIPPELCPHGYRRSSCNRCE